VSPPSPDALATTRASRGVQNDMNDLAIERNHQAREPVSLPPELQADYAELRRLTIFDGLPNGELAAAMASGRIRRQALDRDAFVVDPIFLAEGRPAPVVFVASGQVAAAVFDESDLNERHAQYERVTKLTAEELEEESLIKPAPLARLARKNVALFVEGDLFNSAALSAARGAPVAFYTAAPAVLASIDQGTVAEWASRHAFFEARFRRAITASRERLAGVTGVKQEILDFFVRHGISVSGETVRVRQLDLCIDCKQCEQACEERYGARRLTLGGYQLGMLDFVYTCRTCSDQRCIDPCAYDSIKYDAKKREVVINESTCTGCSACAQSCPYGAIDMVDVIDTQSPTFKSAFKERLDKKKALASGAGTGRVARARRIANKCDHCGAYGDQACISACPTGSLIEVDAYQLFRERPDELRALARAGYDQEVPTRVREVLPTHPFTEGIAVRDGGEAKVRRGRLGPVVLWVVGLAAWLLCLGEIILRLYAPAQSLQFTLLRKNVELASLPADALLERVSFGSGDELAVQCGVVGTALMFIAAIYPVFRRIRVFRWFASNTMWFDFHMMAGTVGPMFVLLHSALALASWVSIAFWSMVIVVVSGVVGRYLYTQVPDMLNGRELEELDQERAFARLRALQPRATAEIDREMREHARRADQVAQASGVLRALFWLVAEDIRRPYRWWARRRRLGSLGVGAAQRRELVRRAGRMLLIHRGRVIAPKAQLLLHSWKKVHVPFTVVLTVFSVAHIWVSWSRAW
jgi:Fe-S-cluster-containing hydrogenase component 2